VLLTVVRFGDFEVALVEAESKNPFKEHAKDGKIYVEVEPDIEHFVAIQKVGTSHSGTSIVQLTVDETKLDYHMTYGQSHIHDSQTYKGLWQVENGMESQKALKFEKPMIKTEGRGSGLLMGKVEIKLYDGIFQGYRDSRNTSMYSHSTNISTAKVGQQHKSVAAKKSLRSGAGTTTTKVKLMKGGKKAAYSKGALLDSITLTYCAALGLIQVGVLPKPDEWTHHRMKNPHKGGPKVETQGSGRENGAIEILDDDN
jgi:hypothetical protein